MSRYGMFDSHSLSVSVRDQLLGTKTLKKGSTTMKASSAFTRSVDVMGTDYISCPSHPSYFLTNICLAQGCVEPLCPECIHEHLETHSKQQMGPPRVDNIQNVRSAYREQVLQYAEELKRDLDDVDNHELGSAESTKDKYLNYSLKQLEDARRKVQNVVEEAFSEMAQQIRLRLSRHYNLEHEFNQVREHIQKELTKVKTILNDFDSPTEYVKATIYAIEKQFTVNKNPVLAQLQQEIHHYEAQLPEVVLDPRALDSVYAAVEAYVHVQQQVPPQQTRMPSFKPSSPRNVRFTNDDDNEPPSNSESGRGALRNNVYMRSSPAQKQDDIVQALLGRKPSFATTTEELKHAIPAYPPVRIEIQSSAPLICSILDDQKHGLLWSFQSNQKQLDVLEFDVENRLPHGHGTVIVQDQVYLLGGIVRDFDRTNAVSAVYKVAAKQSRVQLIGNMINRRQNFGIAVLGVHSIYVVGGSLVDNESQGIGHLERMDIASKKWTGLSPAFHKATGCNLASFHEKFLIKFGGVSPDFHPVTDIEVYNIRKDKWSVVKTFDHNGHLWQEVPSKAGCIQVNKDELLVFGGIVHENRTDDSWLMNLDYGDDVTEIRVQKTHSLPFQAEVKTPVVLHNKRIYAFVSRMEQKNSKRRTLIEGTADGWTQLG